MKRKSRSMFFKGMCAVLATILSVASLSAFTGTAYASGTEDNAEPEVVKVGYFDFQNYMQGAEEDAPKSGYAYDLLQEVAAVNNWTYEYVYGDFNALYPLLLRGDIDILPCLVYTEDRAKNHLFADEEIYVEKYYISALTEKANVSKKIENLDGKRISTVSDCYQNVVFRDWAKQNGISMEIVYTDSFENSWKMVEEGKADYILNIDSATNGSGFTSLFEVGYGSSRFAVNPKREDICQKMNSAFDTIYEINPFTVSHLKEKYLSDTLSSYTLSNEELEWISAKNTVKIAGFEGDEPYSYMDSEGNVTGIYPDVVNLMFKKLNINPEVSWILYDNEEAMYQALLSGEVDLICPFYSDNYYAETKGFIISEEIQQVNMGLMYSGRINEKDIKRIAIPDTDLIRLFVEDFYPTKEIIICENLTECMKAIKKGEADGVVAHISALQGISMKDFRMFNIKTLGSGCPICFAANSGDGTFLCIIDRGVHLISDSDLQELELNYSPNKNYELWNYIKNNKPLVGAILLCLFFLIMFAVSKFVASKKLKKNLKEITEQKKVIEENEKKLIEAEAAANSANKAKSVFLLNMSHDIRTPMNAILGYSNRMIEHLDDKNLVADSANKIKSSGEYLLSLINDVLDMAKIESNQIKIEESLDDITKMAEDVCKVFEIDMQKKKLKFETDFSDIQNNVIWYDTLKIKQILLNLLSNAVKYTEEGGTIAFTIHQVPCGIEHSARFEITVRDTGIGMTPEFVERIFDQFARSDDPVTRQTQGTGLGMSIVKKLVDFMGGTIDVKSRVGNGTEITTTLDFRIPTDDTLFEYKKENSPSTIEKIPSDIRILVVDDNALNREILLGILEDEGCMDADSAENGKEALEKVSASEPGDYDLILIDIQMPVMDGYVAAKRIRSLEDEKLANIPIIALTANAFEEDKQNALAAGMNGHLSKPVDIKKLREALSYINIDK